MFAWYKVSCMTNRPRRREIGHCISSNSVATYIPNTLDDADNVDASSVCCCFFVKKSAIDASVYSPLFLSRWGASVWLA